MKKERIFTVAGKVYVVFSALCQFIVSVQAWYDPQMVMSLVKVELGNNDALSSVRGVYGGVGFTVFITLIYLAFKDLLKGLMFLSFFWGFYILGSFQHNGENYDMVYDVV